MFSWKALRYRLFTALWTLLVCRLFTGEWLTSIEVMITIVVGKFIFFGINEYKSPPGIPADHLEEIEEEDNEGDKFEFHFDGNEYTPVA